MYELLEIVHLSSMRLLIVSFLSMLSEFNILFIPLYVFYASPQQFKTIKSLYIKEKNDIINKLNNTRLK